MLIEVIHLVATIIHIENKEIIKFNGLLEKTHLTCNLVAATVTYHNNLKCKKKKNKLRIITSYII